jgi:hypothetical protein
VQLYNINVLRGLLLSSLAFLGRVMPLGARNAGCFD